MVDDSRKNNRDAPLNKTHARLSRIAIWMNWTSSVSQVRGAFDAQRMSVKKISFGITSRCPQYGDHKIGQREAPCSYAENSSSMIHSSAQGTRVAARVTWASTKRFNLSVAKRAAVTTI